MYELYMKILHEELPVGESFDMLERKVQIGGRAASMFFIDGLTDGEKAQRILSYLMAVPSAAMEGIESSQEFLERWLPFLSAVVIKPSEKARQNSTKFDDTMEDKQCNQGGASGGEMEEKQCNQGGASNGAMQEKQCNQGGASNGTMQEKQWAQLQEAGDDDTSEEDENYSLACDCYRQALPRLYAGLVLLAAEGLDNLILIDCRDYPSRSVEEPDKEQSLRGAKDGFTESMMNNVAMIRRRIRDNNLIFKVYNIGSVSKADVVFVYMKDRADPLLTQKIKKTLEKIAGEAIEKNGGNGCPAGGQDTLSVADQSLLTRLLTALGAAPGLNPFPKVRYTQRPDLVAAHLAEGKAAIITDNSPTVMLIPVSIFEFFQDVDDYYFPQLTGNYFRLIRILNFALILFLTPVYLLITQYEDFTPDILKFFVPEEDFAIPIFWQFVLLELAVDALKLASLNTPSSLGMSLSVIGALILGEFSINSGWFIPQTILCMAVVALAGFTQPSIELSYAMKFCRIFMLVGAGVAGIPGVAAATVISTIFMASTKTIPGKSYLYPLIPFHWNQLKRLIFRTQK